MYYLCRKLITDTSAKAMIILNKDEFFIPFNTPSSKNSRINTVGRSFRSKPTSLYLHKLGIITYSSSKKTVQEYKTRPNLFREIFKDCTFKQYNPLILGYHPIRDSKRKFDLHNVFQIIGDLLTAHDFIEDDNADYLVPIPTQLNGTFYTVDKTNPGMYLKILNN
jgi:hypothetical protein